MQNNVDMIKLEYEPVNYSGAAGASAGAAPSALKENYVHKI